MQFHQKNFQYAQRRERPRDNSQDYRMDSGYGEMVYVEPTGNQILSPMVMDNSSGDERTSPMESVLYPTRAGVFRRIPGESGGRINLGQVTDERANNLVVTIPGQRERFERIERSEASPKTIDIGGGRGEDYEYNIRTLNVKKSPQYQPAGGDSSYFDNRERMFQNNTFEQRGGYGKVHDRSIDRTSPHIFIYKNKVPSGSPPFYSRRAFGYNERITNQPGGTVSLNRNSSPYQNYDEVNTSNEGGQEISPEHQVAFSGVYDPNNCDRTVQYVEPRQNCFATTTHEVQRTGVGSSAPQKDDIQEKYFNKTFNNMTYKDIKKIVRRFTKIYDPNKNNNGILVEESQVILPGAQDEVFNGRYRVLSKMNRLSNILLAKQRRSASPSPDKEGEVYSAGASPERPADDYNIKTFNRKTLELNSKSPLKLPLRRSPENKFKYVSLAMIASKSVNTEDRIILRKMRFEKGGVVDLAQEDRKKGKFKIRKVKRSPGYNSAFSKANPKYREKAAKLIQAWWKEIKELYVKRLKYIILIQSVYRGRFVRKYMYDLLYLNYLYLSFCQKIEKVLRDKIRPYVWSKLFPKKEEEVVEQVVEVVKTEEVKDKNEVLKRALRAIDRMKTRILRKYFHRWYDDVISENKRLLKWLTLIRIRAANESRLGILREAFGRWLYIIRMLKAQEQYENDRRRAEEERKKLEEESRKAIEEQKKIVQEIKTTAETKTVVEEDKEPKVDIDKIKKDKSSKIKGLFKILNGVNKYHTKKALQPTVPRIEKYLSEQIKLERLRRLVKNKEILDENALRKAFYKFLAIALKIRKLEMEKEKDESKRKELELIKIREEERIKEIEREKQREQERKEEEEREKEREREREEERRREEERQREREEELEREKEREREREEERKKEEERNREREEEKKRLRQKEKEFEDERKRLTTEKKETVTTVTTTTITTEIEKEKERLRKEHDKELTESIDKEKERLKREQEKEIEKLRQQIQKEKDRLDNDRKKFEKEKEKEQDRLKREKERIEKTKTEITTTIETNVKEENEPQPVQVDRAKIFKHLIEKFADDQRKKRLRKCLNNWYRTTVKIGRAEDVDLVIKKQTEEWEKKIDKLDKEREKEREREKQKELDREKERQEEKEREKQREKERKEEKEREKQREKERKEEKKKEQEREKERELEKKRELEREKEREREKQKELDRERERQEEKEREKQREKERKEEKEREKQREKERQEEQKKDKKRDDERKKDKEEIEKLKKKVETITTTVTTTVIEEEERKKREQEEEERRNKALLDKYSKMAHTGTQTVEEEKKEEKVKGPNVADSLKACEIIQHFIFTNTHKYPLKAFDVDLNFEKKRSLLNKLLSFKHRYEDWTLKEAFNRWRDNAKYLKYLDDKKARMLYIISLLGEIYRNRILSKKFNQWRRNIRPFQETDKNDILSLGKNFDRLRDILKKICINRHAKEFIDNTKKVKNPRLYTKALKKIISNLFGHENDILRHYLYKWRNNVINKNLNDLKGKLLLALYTKNHDRDIDILNKYFQRWKNNTIIDRITDELNKIKSKTSIETKIAILKNIVKNIDKDSTNYLLKKYFNKWRYLKPNDIKAIEKMIRYIIKKNITKNGNDILKKLYEIYRINKRKELLEKLIPKKERAKKLLLYKYLLRWKNQVLALINSQSHLPFRKKIVSILLTKNDKANLVRLFNKWRYNKPDRVPTNTYAVALKILRLAMTRGPFKNLIDIYRKNNPKIMRPKCNRLVSLLNKLILQRPFKELINRMKLYPRANKLGQLIPKIDDKLSKILLKKYLDRWKENADKITEQKLRLLARWIKRKFDRDQDRINKRKKELILRLVLSKIKDERNNLRVPFRIWRIKAKILSDNYNAMIIQAFCRKILRKIQQRNKDAQDRLLKMLKEYEKLLKIKDIHSDIGKIVPRIREKDEIERKRKGDLTNIINKKTSRDSFNKLREAFEKWRAGQPLYMESIRKIQDLIRQKLARNKLKKLIRRREILIKLAHKYNNTLDNKLLANLRKWAYKVKKVECDENSRIIQDFCRERLRRHFLRKILKLFIKLSEKYPKHYLLLIAKMNKLKNALRKKALKPAFDAIKERVENKKKFNIIRILILKKDKNANDLLLRRYFNKYRDIVGKLRDKENAAVILIQKYIRRYLIKKKFDNLRLRNKLLQKFIDKLSKINPIESAFMRWLKNVHKVACDENARIIQDFCRKKLDKILLRIKNEKLTLMVNRLEQIKENSTNPREFFDRLKKIYRLKVLEELMNKLGNKRLDILRDIFDTLLGNRKLKKLFLIMSIPDGLRNRYLREYLKKWHDKALKWGNMEKTLLNLINKKSTRTEDGLRALLRRWLLRAHQLKTQRNAKIIIGFWKKSLSLLRAKERWQRLVDKLTGNDSKKNIKEIVKRIRIVMGVNKLRKALRDRAGKDVNKALLRNKYRQIFIEKVKYYIEKLEQNSKEDRLRRKFNQWRDNVKKLRDRENALNEMMKILDILSAKKSSRNIYYAMLIKKIVYGYEKLAKVFGFRRIKDYADLAIKNKNLAKDLIDARDDLSKKNLAPLIKNLYKVYAYKVLDNVFARLEKLRRKFARPIKYEFLNLLRMNAQKFNNYEYSNQIQNEKKPYSKKIVFKKNTTVTKPQKQDAEIRNIYKSIAPYLVRYLDAIRKQKLKDTLDNIKRYYIYKKFCDATKKYVDGKIINDKEEFIELLKKLIDYWENKGPKMAKLYKLFRRHIIRRMFREKTVISRMYRLLYLINVTYLNKRIARDRWIRQIIRKWRFISFVKKMAKKKMELMYKNLHVSYLEMVNSMFSDEEEINPSVIKEFERFGSNVGMFVNETPFEDLHKNEYRSMRRSYVFEPFDVAVKKVIKTEEVEEEEEQIKEQYGYAAAGGESAAGGAGASGAKYKSSKGKKTKTKGRIDGEEEENEDDKKEDEKDQ